MINPARWFAEIWPFASARQAVLADYAAIGAQHRHFLADVALRGGVYRAIDEDTDRRQFIAEGRRQLALEIVKLCKVDPDLLFDIVPTKPRDSRP